MLIGESTTRTKWRNVNCFVVDYDRPLPTGWPRLTPVGEYIEAQTNRNAANYVDRIRALELLTLGLTTTQVAARLGCHRSTIAYIRAKAKAAGVGGDG